MVWKKYSKGMTLKSGRYLMCFKNTDKEGECFIEDVYWLNKGDVVMDELVGRLKNEILCHTPEERLLNAIFGSRDYRTINVSGFYHCEWDGAQHFVRATDAYMIDDSYVMEYPEAPEEYGVVCDPQVVKING